MLSKTELEKLEYTLERSRNVLGWRDADCEGFEEHFITDLMREYAEGLGVDMEVRKVAHVGFFIGSNTLVFEKSRARSIEKSQKGNIREHLLVYYICRGSGAVLEFYVVSLEMYRARGKSSVLTPEEWEEATRRNMTDHIDRAYGNIIEGETYNMEERRYTQDA